MMKTVRRNDFWLFWAGQAVSKLGSAFTAFALPLLVYRLTGSALNLAISSALAYLPYILFGLFIGVWADRADRKRLMLAADVGRALVIASIPLLASFGSAALWWLYAAGFLSSTLAVFFDAAQYAAVPTLVGQDDLVAANGLLQASYAATSVAGPLLAGLFVAMLPLETVLYLDALSFIISAFALWLIRTSFNPPTKPQHSSLLADIRAGISYELHQPVLRTISLMLILVNFVAGPINAQLVYYAKVQLHVSDSEWAGFAVAGGLGVIVLSLLAGRIRHCVSFGVASLAALAAYGVLAVG